MILTDIRNERGLSGSAFARLIGASPGQLHDWESGRAKLTVERAAIIERKLNVTGLVDAVVRERTAA